MSEWVTEEQRAKGLNSSIIFSALTADWENMKPVWAGTMLYLLDRYFVASLGPHPLDLYLEKEAKKQGKQVHGIEQVQEQCNVLNDMGTDMAIFYLNETLKEKENGGLDIVKESSIQNIIQGYRQGSLDPEVLLRHASFQLPQSTNNASHTTAHKLEEYVRTNFIQKRNEKMASRIIDLLKKKPDAYFFAFGTLHFIGKDNVPDIIRSSGFGVKRITQSSSGSIPPKPTFALIFGLLIYIKW